MRAVLVALAATMASAQDIIVDYVAASNVTAHNALDRDVRDLAKSAKEGGPPGWCEAYDIYKNGKNSVKGDGMRTLKGFSKPLDGEATYEEYFAYTKSNTSGHDYVFNGIYKQMRANNCSADFPEFADAPADNALVKSAYKNASFSDAVAYQMFVKGVQYQHTWLYSTHELYSALGKCAEGKNAANQAPHAWDEGWAFYVGSLSGEDGSAPSEDGQLTYRMADKRAGDMGTLASDGPPHWRAGEEKPFRALSNVNAKLLRLYTAGLEAVGAPGGARCGEATGYVKEIVAQMTVPLIQGAIKYAYKADPNGGNETETEKDEGKAWAEFHAFASAALPRVHHCDADAAKTIAAAIALPDGADFTTPGVAPEGLVAGGYGAVKAAFESVYECLGITCAEVGGYNDAMPACADESTIHDKTWYYDGLEGLVAVDNGYQGPIVGYQPASDVLEHNKIDLDVQSLAQLWNADDYAGAYAVYKNGENSAKGDGKRTLKGFSKELPGSEEVPELTYLEYFAYHNSKTSGHDYVLAAVCAFLPDEADCASPPSTFASHDLGDVVAYQMFVKGVQYQHTWLYSTHELYSALGKCAEGKNAANQAPHAWDEGWAFYVGSLSGEDGDDPSKEGQLTYRMADKRASDMKTRASDGPPHWREGSAGDATSNVNAKLLRLYRAGLEAVGAADGARCKEATHYVKEIVAQMTVPLIQGAIKYAYKADPNGGNETETEKDEGKAWAEFHAFASAALPRVHHCDADAAKTIAAAIALPDGADFTTPGVAPEGLVAGGYGAVKAAFESVYECLGITCADVGGYNAAMPACADKSTIHDDSWYYDGLERANDVLLPIVGYVPASDVREHNALDKDVKEICEHICGADGRPHDFAKGYEIYVSGKHSAKSATLNRTLRGFSKKLEDEAAYDEFFAYHEENAEYAHDYVRAAVWGKVAKADLSAGAQEHHVTDFTTNPEPLLFKGAVLSDKVAYQMFLKAVQYQHAWIYSLHELYSAVGKCKDGNVDADGGAPHAWDEGWAFYAGSLQGTSYDDNHYGQLTYGMSNKRCGDFKTCFSHGEAHWRSGEEDSMSMVNAKLLRLYRAGLEAVRDATRCGEADAYVKEIVAQMTVPLIQGAIKYAYKADPAGGNETMVNADGGKAWAELHAFTYAALPRVHMCDKDAGAALERAISLPAGADFTTPGVAPDGLVPGGHAAVKAAFESVYECLGITCADVGGFDKTGPACADKSTIHDKSWYYDGLERVADGVQGPIVGYVPASDVIEHNKIDLDVQSLAQLWNADDYAGAYAVYKNGKHSAKGDGKRTLKGFSKPLDGEATYEEYFAYHNSNTSGHDYVLAAVCAFLPGEADCASAPSTFESHGVGLGDEAAYQMFVKAVQYQHSWLYSTHELYSALDKCDAGLNLPSQAPHAWDEGWAFYVGSVSGTDGVAPSEDGQLTYRMADKRCADMGTCLNDKVASWRSAFDLSYRASDPTKFVSLSNVNAKLLALYRAGLEAVHDAGRCAEARGYVADIVAQMTVPLIQGAIKYAYKADPNGGNETETEKDEGKAWAEFHAFASAALPRVHHCDADAAKTIAAAIALPDGADFTTPGVAPEGLVAGGYGAVKAAFESVYECLGITCADVGSYNDAMPACRDYSTIDDGAHYYAALGRVADGAPGFDPIAGYVPASNVLEHNKIDLDVQLIDAHLGGTDAAFETYQLSANNAWRVYKKGASSAKGDGLRTLRGFSKALPGEATYEEYFAYHNDSLYADAYVRGALWTYLGGHKGDDADWVAASEPDVFAGMKLSPAMTDQFVVKGVQYQHAWIYATHELYSAVGKCEKGEVLPAQAPHAWDEGWAFYTGSLQGTSGAGGGSGEGQLSYQLADKRCADFGTCHAAAAQDDSKSAVNGKLLALYRAGLEAVHDASRCREAATYVEQIVAQMTVPLIQGAIKYAEKADPASGKATATDHGKAYAEFHAFTTAALPRVAQCDAAAGMALENALALPAGADFTPNPPADELQAALVPGGFAAVKAAFESVYECLGITCADVGAREAAGGGCVDARDDACYFAQLARVADGARSREPLMRASVVALQSFGGVGSDGFRPSSSGTAAAAARGFASCAAVVAAGMCDDDVLALACATECDVACALPEKYEHLTGEIYSAGSCYDMATHSITCDVAPARCRGLWYAPDFVSSRSGCSHCDAANKGDAGFGFYGACRYTPFDATVSGGARFYEVDHDDLAAQHAEGRTNCTAWAAAGHTCSSDAVGALLCGAHCYVAHPVDNDAASGNTTCAAAVADTGCDAFVAYACPATCQASLVALGYGELTGDDYLANNDALAAARFNSSCADLVAQCGAADVALACPEVCEGWSAPSAAPTPTPAPRKPKKGCGRAALASEKKCNKNKRCKWVFGSHACMSDCALANKKKSKCNKKKHCKYNKSAKKCKNKKHVCKYKTKKKLCRKDESCRVGKGKKPKYDAKGNRVFRCRDRKN